MAGILLKALDHTGLELEYRGAEDSLEFKVHVRELKECAAASEQELSPEMLELAGVI